MSTYAGRELPRASRTTIALAATVSVGICLLLAFVVAVTAGDCNAALAIPRLCNATFGVPAAIVIAALPIVISLAARRPFAWLMAAYIILVPIDDALLLGPSWSVTKIVGLAVAVAAIATVLRRRAAIALPGALFVWAALLGLLALSIIWSIAPDLSIPTVVTIFSTFALMFVIVATPIDRVDLRAVIGATIASGAIIGVVALVAARHELSTIAGQVGRLYLNFGSSTADPNRFGAALLCPIAMTVGAIGQSKGWRRVGLLALLALTLTAVYLSASRDTTLALLAMAIVGIAASRHRLPLAAALLAAVALVLLVPNEITSRFLTGDIANSFATGTMRVDIWRVALPIFHAHWLLGTGVGTFPAAYDRAFFAAYQPQFPGWARDPHSLLISTSTELGIVGMVMVGTALVAQYRSVRFIGPDHPYPWLRTVFAAAFIGLLVAAFFVDVMATKFAWLLFTEMLLAARLGSRTPPFKASG